MLEATWKQNDKKAYWLIGVFSAIVFLAVTILDQITLEVDLGFNPHIFATLSASVNSAVSVLLLAGLYFVKQKNFATHKKVMLFAMGLSVLFLVFYIAHHLFAGQTRFGDINHDGELDSLELQAAGSMRMVYFFIISTHIILAGLVMPFVLLSAYRALTGEWPKHKKLVRYTFPIWLYVAITGVVVYWMISPYYA
jgi:putative membrane protein